MSGPTKTATAGPTDRGRLARPVYVYGVIPASDALGWPAVAGLGGPSRPVRAVVEGRFAALVSDLEPDHTPGRREDLDTHRQVLTQAIERGTTIPVRFGMVMDGDDAVRRRLLAGHADDLDELEADLDGHVQMMVKAFYVDDALLRDVLAADPALARESAALRSRPEPEAHAARVRLGEAVARAVDARREEVEAALAAELAPLIEDVEIEEPSSERVALTAQLLVRRDRRAALDERVRALASALSGLVAFRYVGPLPPYSFASMELEEDGESWG